MTAVRVRTASGWQDVAIQGPQGQPGLLFAEKKYGLYGGYIGPFSPTSENQIWRDAAGTIPLSLTYTPQVDCWWDTSLHMGLVQKTDANYHYAQISLKLSPADVDGESYEYCYLTQHASVQQYSFYNPTKMWKLAAGTAYTVSGAIQVSGGTWQYHAGTPQMGIQGLVYPRGSISLPASPARVTTLPASPTDGQEVYYVADATNGVIWHLRYNAGSASAYKWEFVGGPPMMMETITAAGPTNNQTYSAIGPTLTVPRAGEYEIELWGNCGGDAGWNCLLTVKLGAVAASDNEAIGDTNTGGVSPPAVWTAVSRKMKRTLAASDVLATYARSTGGAWRWSNYGVHVRPVRLS